MNGLDSNYKQFTSHYQNILILKELQNIFGDIYLGGKKTKVSYDFFIVTNTRINQHMVDLSL